MMLSVAPVIPELSKPVPPRFVLIVDDHEPTLHRLKALVEDAGHRCVAAASAAEALIYCDQHCPSLVITDFSMPRLNGDGLARWLKARYPEMPMLLVTGDLLETKSLRALETMFVEVIRKPLEIESFVKLLNRLMQRSGKIEAETKG